MHGAAEQHLQEWANEIPDEPGGERADSPPSESD
jgi:hypothetical protein